MAGPLSNPRYERFAQERFKGLDNDKAYVKAGFASNRGNAARLNSKECVKQRIAELQAEAAAKTVNKAAVIDKRYVLQQAHRLHETCMAHVEGEDGFNGTAANVASRALEQIGKHVDVRAFSEQRDVSIHVTVDHALSQLEAIEGEYTIAGPEEAA